MPSLLGPDEGQGSDAVEAEPAEIQLESVARVVHKESRLEAVGPGRFTDLPASRSDVVVEVIDADGLAVADARVIPWMGNAILDEGFTDLKGQVSFSGLVGRCGFAVDAPNYLTAYFQRNLEELPVSLRLPKGQTVAGRVSFFGSRYNPNPFRMTLGTRPHVKPDGVPDRVLNDLQYKGILPGFTDLTLDQNNEFRVQGLPDLWAGRLGLPTGALFKSVRGPIQVDQPTQAILSKASENLILEVMERRGIAGRVVSPDGRLGVPGVELVLRTFIRGVGVYPIQTSAVSKEGGAFYIPYWLPSPDDDEEWKATADFRKPERVEILLGGSPEWAGTSYSFDAQSTPDIWGLGDLPMAERRTVEIRVIDELGDPIEGALAYAGQLSKASDENGNIQVGVWPNVKEMAVNAVGFLIAKKNLLDEPSATIEFVLPRAVRLELRWSSQETVDLSTAEISIRSVGDVFEGEEGRGSFYGGRFRKAFGLRYWSGGGKLGGANNMQWKLEPGQNEFSIWGLKPGVAMEVDLVNSMNTALASSGELEFTSGEQRTIELSLPIAPHGLHGKVLDSGGAPLSGVQLKLINDSGWGFAIETGLDGGFEFADLAAAKVELSLRKEGYADLQFESYAVPKDGSAVEFIMDFERQMTFYLRDASGHNYQSGYVSANGESSERTEGNSGFLLRRIPQNTFELFWWLGGISGTEQIPGGVSEHVILVPAMASALIHVPTFEVPPMYSISLQFVPWRPEATSSNFKLQKSFELNERGSVTDVNIPALRAGEYQVLLKLNAWDEGQSKWVQGILQEVGPVRVLVGQNLELTLGP